MSTASKMTLIETKTIGAGGSATLEFTGIPNTYTDIQVVISARSDSALGTGNVAFNLAINSSTADKTFRRLYGGGGSTGSDTPSTSARAGSAVPTSTATASTFNNVSYYFPNYASTSIYKSFSLEGVTENNSSSVYEIDMAGLLWSSNSAITSLSFTMSDGSNFVQYSSASLYGIKSASKAAKATGGTITQSGGYWYHTFTSSGTFTPTVALTADVLVVAGGGAGGGRAPDYSSDYGAGGGGAGGLVYSGSQSLSSTGYVVTVGAGGPAGTTSNSSNGNNSSFAGLTAAVGGGAGGSNGGDSSLGRSGGSGGGGAAGGNAGGSGTSGQGYAGGYASSTSGERTAAGGGGAGAVGNPSVINTNAGSGGVGLSYFGAYYAGGGGGGNVGGVPAGSGGSGGGGAGGRNAGGTSGTANTGGGGGGSGAYGVNSGNGGSGIVIVRYAV